MLSCFYASRGLCFYIYGRLINDPALKQEIGLMACQQNLFSSVQMQQQHGEYNIAIK
jgi:hypothetical protein